MNPSRKRNRDLRIEMFLVFVIALLLLFLINFADNKLNEIITSDKEALLIEHDPDNPVHEELANKILDFRPDACKMIEVYSSDFKPLFRVQFEEPDDYSDNLLNHQDLVDLFKTHKDGHTSVIINDTEEDIYFRWEQMSSGEMCLIIIYMSRPVVTNLWVFHVVCYGILILVCILMIRLYLKNHAEKIKYYRKLSCDVQDSIIK